MRFASACAAAGLAAASVVAFAAPAAAEDCVRVDGDPALCVSASAVPGTNTSDGATVSLTVDADVCSSLVTLPTCDRGAETLSVGDTGVTGFYVAVAPTGPTPVHVPEVCVNTSPCVGPYNHTVPSVDAPCAELVWPAVVVNGSEVARADAVAGGTC